MNKILTTIFCLTIIRFLSFFDGIKSNFEIILRPGQEVYDISYSSKILLIILGLVVIFSLTRVLKKTNSNIKNIFFYYFLFYYVISSLFQRNIYNNCSYLFFIQSYNINWNDLLPLLIEDLFFEAPYSFWFIIFMLSSFFVLKNKNCQEYSIVLWIIPFYFINIPLNSIFLTLIVSNMIISLLGINKQLKGSPFYYILFQLIIYLVTVIWIIISVFYKIPILLTSCEIIILYFIPSLILIKKCINSKNPEAIASTWTIPTTTLFFIANPMTRFDFAQSLLIPSSFTCSFIYIGNISLIVSLVIIICFLINYIKPCLRNISLKILSICAILYYLLDATLYHYSHFRLNLQTVSWTMAMNNAFRTTFKTCLEFVSMEAWFILFAAICVFFFLFKNSNNLFNSKNILIKILIPVILSAQFSSAFILIMSRINPIEMQDPFFLAIKGIKLANSSSRLSDSEIMSGFAECKIPMTEYLESNSVMGNNYNLILVTLESVHWRYLDLFSNSTNTWPRMSKYTNRMELFPYFFSCFPESTTADISVVSGLQPYSQSYVTSKETIPCPTIVDELKKANYETYLFSSGSLIDGNLISIVKNMPFTHVLSFKISDDISQKDYWYWGFKEEKTVNDILTTLKKRKNNNPFFIWYRTMYPHSPFTVFEEYTTVVFKKKSPLEKDILTDYKNCLIYLDKQLSRLVEGITQHDLTKNQKTIIVLVADHGEMLGEKDNLNLIGHGLYAPAKLTNVPLIILHPNATELKINTNIGSQIDVLPTLLDCLNLKPSLHRFGQGKSLLINNLEARPVFLSSHYSYAVIEDGYYFSFEDKDSNNCVVRKLSLDNKFKAEFKRVENYPINLINEKYDRVKKYYQLLKEFFYRY